MISGFQPSGFQNNAFQIGGDAPPAPVPDDSPIRDSSLRHKKQHKRPEEKVRLARVDQQAANTIAEIALRQNQRNEALDDQQQLDELRGELKLVNIDMQTEHIDALNLQREMLAKANIENRKLQEMQDEAIILLLLASESELH